MMALTILNIQDDRLVATHEGKVVATITNLVEFRAAQLVAARETGGLYCSSSIDFPEESTSNPAVIAFCRMLRS